MLYVIAFFSFFLFLIVIVFATKQQLCMNLSQNLVVIIMDHRSSLDSGT